jgi:hypothetical protein
VEYVVVNGGERMGVAWTEIYFVGLNLQHVDPTCNTLQRRDVTSSAPSFSSSAAVQRNRKRSNAKASGLIPALNALLRTRYTLQLRGWSLRLVKEPAAARPVTRPAPHKPADPLPPMPGRQVIAAHLDLRAHLDRAPAARRIWPSLALLERALCTGGFDGIHRVDACVLRHAARALDTVGDQYFSPGLVVLRRRIELVLRRKHLDEPTHWARTPGLAGARRRSGASDTLTDYIDLDRMMSSGAGPAAAGRPAALRGRLRP